MLVNVFTPSIKIVLNMRNIKAILINLKNKATPKESLNFFAIFCYYVSV